MKKAAIATLGCKVNQVESGSLAEQLKCLGYEITGFSADADIYIINTCTVTNRADYKCRNLIRQALKAKAANPDVKVIVTGCYAQKEIDEVRAFGEIDLVVDNQSKVKLKDWLANPEYKFREILSADEFAWTPVDRMHDRTRAFLKIQDGCDYYCSYCAVPYGRGNPRSLDFEQVISQANTLVQNGYREIVLTGINLGLYKDSKTGKKLANVIQAMDKIGGLNLLRLSSLEPDLLDDELLDAITDSEQVCPHFHIALQSGSDSVLHRMKRRYSALDAEKLVNELLTRKPDGAIGLDVICGFPGETDAEYHQTYDFISGMDITYLHVFGYSKRSRTPAAVMPEQVHGEVIDNRVNGLMSLAQTKKTAYINKLVHKQVNLSGVIEKQAKGIGTALSDHYIRIYASGKEVKKDSIISGKAIETYQDGILIQVS